MNPLHEAFRSLCFVQEFLLAREEHFEPVLQEQLQQLPAPRSGLGSGEAGCIVKSENAQKGKMKPYMQYNYIGT